MRRTGTPRQSMQAWQPILITLYGNQCYICGTSGTLTVDHVQPRSQGGEDSESNLRLCCRDCNKYKNAIEVYMSSPQYYKITWTPTSKQLAGIQVAYRYFTDIRKQLQYARNTD